MGILPFYLFFLLFFISFSFFPLFQKIIISVGGGGVANDKIYKPWLKLEKKPSRVSLFVPYCTYYCSDPKSCFLTGSWVGRPVVFSVDNMVQYLTGVRMLTFIKLYL